MDCSMPGFPVHHQLPEICQTRVHWVSDAIQPPHPLLPPSLSAFNLSQYQGLFQWVSSSHQVTKVLEFQLWRQSFQWIFRADFLEDWLVWSPCSPRDSQASSPTAQFKSICSRGQYNIVEERLGIRGTWFWFWSIYPSTLDTAGYSVWGILKLFRPLLCRQWNGQSWG